MSAHREIYHRRRCGECKSRLRGAVVRKYNDAEYCDLCIDEMLKEIQSMHAAKREAHVNGLRERGTTPNCEAPNKRIHPREVPYKLRVNRYKSVDSD